MSLGKRAAGATPTRSEPEPPSAPVAEGEVLAGKYKVERVLGVGGMGVVVAARHLQLDQLVALKFVLPSAVEDRLVTERFLREAKAAARLKSEHVAKVLDVGTLETGAPYIVMEYLEGTTLAEVIALQAPLPADVACDYLIQACEALSEAHTLGIVHRDLKPQNLFLTKGIGGAPLVKVLDFGISKIREAEGAHHLTQTTTVIGSPLYMAPEQMRSARNADPRSDIWALGVVLYELLARQLPFEAETITDLAIKIVQEPFPPLEQLRPELSPGLSAVVSRCLEKDPGARFADAGELASALEPFAPASSHIVADRARKVVSAHSKTLGFAVSPAFAVPSVPPARGSSPTATKPSADGRASAPVVPAPTKNTPSMPAWSDTKGGPPQKTRTWLLASIGVALVVAVIEFRAFDRLALSTATPAAAHAAEGPTPTPTSTPTATATPTATPTPTPTATATPTATPTPTPTPTSTPTSTATPTPTPPQAEAAPPQTATASTTAPLPKVAVPSHPTVRSSPRPGPPSPKPSASASPSPSDRPNDDIPSLR